MRKGDTLEAKSTKYFHQKGVPALISPIVLRSKDLGQIDIAYLEKSSNKAWVLKIIEIKSSIYPDRAQVKRLLGTQDYLSRLLEIESKLEVKFCQKADHSLSF